MADEKTPLTGEPEVAAESAEAAEEAIETAAEQTEQAAEAAEAAVSDAAENAAGTVSDAESAMDNALNELDSLLSENAKGEAEPETAEQPDAAEAEADAAGAEPEAAPQENAPKKPVQKKKPAQSSVLGGILPKKKKKKRARKRTVEDELADLAAEEAAFDSWGRPIKKKRKRGKRRKTRKLSCTLVLLTTILALSSVLSVAILAVAKEMYGIEKGVDQQVVTIPEGASTREIAEILKEEKIISLPEVFRFISRMKGADGQYIASDHVLKPCMSYEAMIAELCRNYVKEGRETQKVVIPEGYTLLQAAQRLKEYQICDPDKFIFFFNSGNYGFEFEDYLPEASDLKFMQMEGYCFPDTYEFYVGEDPNIVAQKIYANFNSKLTDGDYKKMNELNMSLDQIITLASMIQAESSDKKYMKQVSSVFHNRLLDPADFAKLQSDPTRKYAEETIAPNLDRDNETMCNAYNTYTGVGLPPGAICNPGRAAIEAALYPDQTNYYYFNANIDTRETFFAETLEQHNQNLAMVQAQYDAANAAENGES